MSEDEPSPASSQEIPYEEILSKIENDIEEFEKNYLQNDLKSSWINKSMVKTQCREEMLHYDAKIPYSTFKELINPLEDHIHQLKKENKEFLILGSCVGWIGFCFCLTFEIPCIGYEQVPFYLEFAKSLAEKYNLSNLTVFENKKFLDVNVANAGIVWISTLGQREKSIIEFYEKFYWDLPRNAKIISYQKPPQAIRENFTLLDYHTPLKTKKNHSEFYIFKKRLEKTENDPSKNLAWTKLPAEKGNSNDQLRLGLEYCIGTTVEKNEKEATKWLLLSASQENEEAFLQLGLKLQDGTLKKNYDEAFKWLEKAKEKNLQIAQDLLESLCTKAAEACANTERGKQHLEKMYQWLMRAKSLKLKLAHPYIESLFLMTVSFQYTQNSVAESFNEAYKWLALAVKDEIPQAKELAENFCMTTAMNYYNGRKLKQDYEMAYHWLMHAKEYNSNDANKYIAYICLLVAHKYYSKKEYEKSYQWLMRGKEYKNKEIQKFTLILCAEVAKELYESNPTENYIEIDKWLKRIEENETKKNRGK